MKSNKTIFLVILLSIFLFPLLLNFLQNQQRKTIYELKSPVGSFLNIDNTDIYYELTGEKDKPYVVLIHGFGGNTYSFRKNVSTFHELGYQTLAIDLPPFGLSQKSRYTDINQDTQADVVKKILDELKIDKASFVGHSYGGGVALFFANKYPNIVDKLIIVDGAINEQGENRIKPLTNIIKLPVIADYTKSLISLFISESRGRSILKSAYYNPELVTTENINGYLIYGNVKDWQEGYLAMLTTPYTSTNIDYEKINTLLKDRVFLIWGREDKIVPLSKGEVLNKKISSSKIFIIDKSGHLPMEENSVQYNKIIDEIF